MGSEPLAPGSQPDGPAPEDFQPWLESVARTAGFSAVGVAPARLHGPDGVRLKEWLLRGYHGTMGYMAQGPDRRFDANWLLPGARSVIIFAAPYAPPPVWIPPQVSRDVPHSPSIHAPEGILTPPPGQVRVAAYATGLDYHFVLKKALSEKIIPLLQERWPQESFRPVTDSAPLLERAYAVRAGLGFIGKNTLHIIPGQGSFHFLASIVTTAPLPRTGPMIRSALGVAHRSNKKRSGSVVPQSVGPIPTCGQCRRCLDACPTQAFPAPYILDARRCISYLTIENREEPGGPGEPLGVQQTGLVFGCDICQQVCPYNKQPVVPVREEFREGRVVYRDEPPETYLIHPSHRAFGRRFAGSPFLRAGARRLLQRVRQQTYRQQQGGDTPMDDAQAARGRPEQSQDKPDPPGPVSK